MVEIKLHHPACGEIADRPQPASGPLLTQWHVNCCLLKTAIRVAEEARFLPCIQSNPYHCKDLTGLQAMISPGPWR